MKFNSLPSTKLEISSPFGIRVHPITGEKTMHNGVDIRPYKTGAKDDNIRSVMPGIISNNYFNSARGWVVIIDHGIVCGQCVKTLYQHLAYQSQLKYGFVVTAGQQIGIMGTTGASTGIHLHFELILDGKQVDPEPYLKNIRSLDEMTYEEFKTHMTTYRNELSAMKSNIGMEYDNAIIGGITDGTRPRDFATRQEVAVMVNRSKDIVKGVIK